MPSNIALSFPPDCERRRAARSANFPPSPPRETTTVASAPGACTDHAAGLTRTTSTMCGAPTAVRVPRLGQAPRCGSCDGLCSPPRGTTAIAGRRPTIGLRVTTTARQRAPQAPHPLPPLLPTECWFIHSRKMEEGGGQVRGLLRGARRAGCDQRAHGLPRVVEAARLFVLGRIRYGNEASRPRGKRSY